ncbi:ribose transport system substrate-binding protein [Pseudarthrobacter sp. PvP004]|uniref:substrate-binding domain-containing protein n=1 Tax=Pseudarthrobacter sp. PvP004 TaxID=2817850 RepID=UPI001AE7277C|nr:substrate-binding domain-containing protein [Pseudarthrobacter sp. PvP004]MBP2266374.1 ribose transport system substrate-binding protein [Pseudarthrobacter sp. PvP004]
MKIRKAFGPTIAVSLLALSLAACSNPAVDAPSAGSTDSKLPASCSTEKPTIGVALPNTINPYYVAMQDSFKKHGQELGFDVKVAIANDSDSTQLSQVDSFIQQKVCAVALNAVNSGPGAASVKALNAAGIPVFTVNVIISPDDLKTQNASFVQYVGADQVAGGKQMGEQVLKDLGADAKIVAGIIGNPDQIPTNQRDQGFKDALSKNSNASTVQTVNGKIDPSVSLQVTGDLLQGNPGINVLFADAGPHAVGALQAVAQQGKADKVKVYAFCAADQKLNSTYAACAAQEPAKYAQIVLDNMKKHLAGESVDKEVLEPLKVFVDGQTPGQGEVG